MLRPLLRRASLLLALPLLGCPASPTSTGVVVGQSFRLAPGESAALDGAPRMTFSGVTEDSRCPTGVVCIRAGEVVVDVAFAGGASVSLRPGESTRWGDTQLQLVGVTPYPTSGGSIAASAYRATFVADTGH